MELRSGHCVTPRHAAVHTLFAALLVAQGPAVVAQTCSGPLPNPNTPPAATAEKFQLIAKQCTVLAEPARVQRASQLDIYDRGASVTVRMTADPQSAAAASAPVSKPVTAAPLGRDGKRVVSLVPAVTAAARENGLDPLLLHAIAHVESRHNPAAVSRVGARGVMQVMPDTGRRFGVDQPERSLMDAHTNVRAGAAYLRMLNQRYGGDLRLTLAAYNAGEGAVARHGGVPPYPETRAYVRDVLAIYRRLGTEFSLSPDGELVPSRRSS